MVTEIQPDLEVVAFQPAAPIEYDDVTEPFWRALEEGELRLQRCRHCGTYKSPPTLYCWSCLSTENDWPLLGGEAVLYTYSVIPLDRAARDGKVYVAALACPVEAPDTKIFCNVIDCDVSQLRVGMALHFAGDQRRKDIVLFRPGDTTAGGARS